MVLDSQRGEQLGWHLISAMPYHTLISQIHMTCISKYPKYSRYIMSYRLIFPDSCYSLYELVHFDFIKLLVMDFIGDAELFIFCVIYTVPTTSLLTLYI